MEKAEINLRELRDFVQFHRLRNSHSIIQFNAIITIKTIGNKLTNEEIDVDISFDGYNNYGTVTLLESFLDPLLFPTQFDAKWQEMEHKDKEFLLIKGNHSKNPEIGKYEVKILPIRKLRE